jgi:hypothetical protein
MYGIEVTFMNFIKKYTNLFKRYLGGGGRQAENSDLINITFFFKESRLKNMTD